MLSTQIIERILNCLDSTTEDPLTTPPAYSAQSENRKTSKRRRRCPLAVEQHSSVVRSTKRRRANRPSLNKRRPRYKLGTDHPSISISKRLPRAAAKLRHEICIAASLEQFADPKLNTGKAVYRLPISTTHNAAATHEIQRMLQQSHEHESHLRIATRMAWCANYANVELGYRHERT
jgi:hypothetical protein